MAITNSGVAQTSTLKAHSLKKTPALKPQFDQQRTTAAGKLWCLSSSSCLGTWIFFGALSFGLGFPCIHAADDVARVTSISSRPRRVYNEAKERYVKETNSVEAAWEFGRAVFDLADVATNDSQRAALAQEGIDACRRGLRLDPNSPGAHYYLGLNYGQLAQTKLLGALELVDYMEESWKMTIQLDPKFDYAGGHRTLGVLYRDAPGWPTSVGSRAKAREHLQQAVEICPEYPGNRLTLFEAYVKWGEKKTVRQQVKATEEFLKAARQKLSGESWELDWRDWDQRWEKIKARCAVTAVRSPRETR
jgi:tetratricopeptide (TPR) repeat protein